MITTALPETAVDSGPIDYATFYLGDLLLGINIHTIQEINRHLAVTETPHAPDCVRGVVNLRSEVVTVIDLSTVLQVERTVDWSKSLNIIVNSSGERIGLLVERIADVVSVRPDEIDTTLANLHGVDDRFFEGVFQMESELLVILDVEEILAVA